MTYQKVLPYLIVAVVAIAVTQVSSLPKPDRYAANGSQYHDLIVGSRRPGDRVVVTQNVRNSSSPYPVQRQYLLQRGQVITLLRVADGIGNGNGGYARIVKGGPGANNVTLEFARQSRYGFNFNVYVYALY